MSAFNIGWPEGIWFALIILGIFLNVAKDGEPKTENYSAGVYLCSAVLSFFLLWWGGFFS